MLCATGDARWKHGPGANEQVLSGRAPLSLSKDLIDLSSDRMTTNSGFARHATPDVQPTQREAVMSAVLPQAGTMQGMQLSLAVVSERGELISPLPADPTSEELAFYADLVTLAKRVQRHRPWAQKELFLMIENAASAGLIARDLSKGMVVLKQASQVYDRDLLSKNRIRYVVGTGIGVLVLIALAAVTVALTNLPSFSTLAAPQMIIALFAFAGIGSAASVLTRLSTMDLKDETSKGMLLLSGASKPLIAIAFASIVYIVLKHQLVAVSMGASSKPDSADAAIWVAAFLCGFSERFASDIIAKLEPKSTT